MKLTLNIDPRPQSRARFTRFGKPYEVAEMKLWRNQCKFLIANQYMGQPILEGALRAKLRFYIQALLDEIIPVDKKPDIDNYEKALYDSMSGVVFKDDGQIAMHDVGKFYSLKPRIEVEIEEINQQETKK